MLRFLRLSRCQPEEKWRSITPRPASTYSALAVHATKLRHFDRAIFCAVLLVACRTILNHCSYRKKHPTLYSSSFFSSQKRGRSSQWVSTLGYYSKYQVWFVVYLVFYYNGSNSYRIIRRFFSCSAKVPQLWPFSSTNENERIFFGGGIMA